MTTTDVAPTSGPCTPWCDATAIKARPDCSGLDDGLAGAAAAVASEILYALSGRQFTGSCDMTVRPTARPTYLDTARWSGLVGAAYGSWGTCDYAYGSGYGGAALAAWSGHACGCYPAELELGGYPITAITQVKIDGTVIPAAEYRVDDHRLLVRVRPTDGTQPTARAGWPVCQRLDLADTEPGTFSVEFTYGAPPPAAGVLAATILAAEIALAGAPDGEGVETRLPARVRSLVRQGESITLIDPQDVLDKGRTGIPEVDLFLKAYNPTGLQRRSSAWSPDLGRTRQPTITTS